MMREVVWSTTVSRNRLRNWHRIAFLLWMLPAVAIVAWVFLHPLNRGVTEIYHDAFANWRAQRSLYSGSSGFNYLPVFVPFFGLFARLPLLLCEILWRTMALAGLCLGLWRCTRILVTGDAFHAFAIVSLVSLPICLSALRNGQSSAQLAASLVLTAWCLHTQRWWSATFWLCLALVCKPLAVPAIGLAVVAFPRIWWRTALGVMLVLALPYLLAPWTYVNDQYVSFAANLVDCFDPADRSFADLNGVLAVINVKLTGLTSLIVRVAAGGAIAIACLFSRRLGDIRRALIWLALAASYIMLFTPMNEGNSYVILAPSLGLWAWWYVENGKIPSARLIGLMSAMIFMLPDILGFALGKSYANEFGKFLYPFLTLVFLGIVVRQLQPGRDATS